MVGRSDYIGLSDGKLVITKPSSWISADTRGNWWRKFQRGNVEVPPYTDKIVYYSRIIARKNN